MDVTSDEIRSSRFQGTRHVYDRREVDAFLHRTATTLEVYERKLAVTQAHVESLEKALDLAHHRARSVRSRETRIAELEAALAAAQHNYESATALLEAQNAAVAEDRLVVETRGRAEALLAEATDVGTQLRTEGERIVAEAAEIADKTTMTAQAEADEMRKAASLEHAAMLEEFAQARVDAKGALESELETKRSAALAEIDVEKVRLAGDTAADQVGVEARLAKTERKAASAEENLRKRLEVAEERARAAKAENTILLEDIERNAAAAEAERKVFMEDAERMFEEAVARAEAARAVASREAPAATTDQDAEEVAGLRRQVAQLRSALSGIHERLRDSSGLSGEELELAAALAALDVDGGQVIDLTAAATAEIADVLEPPGEAGPNLTLKSKWAELQPMHAGPRGDAVLAEGGDEVPAVGPALAAGPTWRDTPKASGQTKPVGEADNEDAPVIGFYERRLAGLRSRLKDAGADDR